MARELAERFERVILPETGFLARVARALSRSEADAEDLAQETLLKAYRALAGFDGAHPRAWLFRIALNTAINRSRRIREVPTEDEAILGVAEAGGEPAEDPAAVVAERPMDEVLRRALDELPPSFRVVVLLVDVEGMRYQEAANLLGVPVGTVMSRLHRARARLRRAVAGTHLDPTRRP